MSSCHHFLLSQVPGKLVFFTRGMITRALWGTRADAHHQCQALGGASAEFWSKTHDPEYPQMHPTIATSDQKSGFVILFKMEKRSVSWK